MIFSTVVGMGTTLAVSGVTQIILVAKGKKDLAETLNLLTKFGAVSYSAYFLWDLFKTVVSTFL